MSNKAAFRRVAEGQLPPDAWYWRSLDIRYPHLEPCSQIGEMAIALDIEWEAANNRQIKIPPLETADQYYVSLERHKLFTESYEFILSALEGRLESAAGQSPGLDYQKAVDRVWDLKAAELGCLSFISPQGRGKLQKSLQTLCVYYAMEEDKHFRAIDVLQ